MSCYHPFIGLKNKISDKSGELIYSVTSSKEIDYKFLKEKYPDAILIPCGKCKGCRIDKSRQWADRMSLEYDHTKKACFVTLTYDDDNLPISDLGYPTLVKADLQKFMKDLRGNKFYDNKEIRFYASGEYGENPCFGSENFRYGRPHYHVILFGLGLSDFTERGFVGDFKFPDFYVGNVDHKLYYDGQNELHQPHFRSPHLDNVVWKKGRCCIAEFSWETAAYTARYVRKKLDGPLSSLYDDIGIQAPFALMSRMPGIGSYFIKDHPEKDFFEEDNFSIGGKNKPLPNFVFDKLAEIDPIRYNQIKDARRRYADDAMMLKLSKTDLSLSELLRNEEIDFENRTKVLNQRI